jgi:arginyl-tRNA synthetase
MYAYARTRSILREVGDVDESQIDWSLLDQETESDLLGHLADYPAQVERAVAELSPQIVCVYAYELCKRFSRWYHQGSEDRDLSVKNAPTDALRATRLQLVDATGRVIQHALSLLGISTIERM